MSFVTRIRSCLVGGAILGMLMPQVGFATSPADGPIIRDAALQSGGVVRGALISSAGRARADRPVNLLLHGKQIASTTTDVDGRFQFRGVRAGVYRLQAAGADRSYRLWSEAAAPPSADAQILLLENDQLVVRGKKGGGTLAKPLLLGGLLLAAGVIGGVIGYNIKDDAS